MPAQPQWETEAESAILTLEALAKKALESGDTRIAGVLETTSKLLAELVLVPPIRTRH